MISETAFFDEKTVKIVLFVTPNERFFELLTIIFCLFISFLKNI